MRDSRMSPRRRGVCLAALPVLGAGPWQAAALAADNGGGTAQAALAALEARSGGRLGVAAIDAATGASWRHRADERFPMCSTFKLMLAAAVLSRSTLDRSLLRERLSYVREDLIPYSPVTQHHVEHGMTVADLCAAAVQQSDNTAANLLMKRLGGPQSVTVFVRAIGDSSFRLDRWEPELNSALPGDPRDTCTPLGMASSLQKLALGEALPAAQRDQLTDWLRGSSTGRARIQAGTPAAWRVGDKTGTGAHGRTNDLGVLWPPTRAPIVLALYFTQTEKDAKPREDVLAEATRIVVRALPG